jgi:16S rRNA G966 N2-methylase RsmD
MIRKASPETDQISRSLLQKAVRRGNLEVTKLSINNIIRNNDFDWLRKRLAVVTFEECWTYGLEVSYEKNEEIVTEHYIKIARTVKNKNAAGLGSLAYALSRGDLSVFFGDQEDKAIKIIAEAIKRPNDFWEWTRKQKLSELQRLLVEKADKGFRKAGWPWDRAFAQAAAYLAISTQIPEIQYTQASSTEDFPFWVGIDKHTQEGKKAIREAAKRIGFNANKALWLAFYFESVKCNALYYSPWWEKEIAWRMKKIGLAITEANAIWEKMRPILIELLTKEAINLKEKILNLSSIKPQINIQMPLL